MDESLLEVRSFDGSGYQPLIDYGAWRVAILRYLDDIQPDRIDKMERHTETDEVFVLLQGRGVLLIGGNGAQVDAIRPQVMEKGRIYNVKRFAWHTILLSRDASVLLVENRETGWHNSESAGLNAKQRAQVMELAKQASFE
jgi:mannose-6-phosphate isomerase-like protein (cupin superfamily)